MAQKRPYEESESLTGYLSEVSPVKTSASGITKYFTAKFQTSKEEVRRLVSFSPEKHAEFMRSSQSPNPVKLTNAMLKVGPSGDVEISTNRNTKMEVSTAKINFKRQILAKDKDISCSKLDSLTTEHMTASVNVKLVGFIDDKKQTVSTRYGTKQIKKGIVSDETKSMKITFWSDISDQLVTGESYRMTSLVIKSFEGELILNTTRDTVCTAITAINNVDTDIAALLKETTQDVHIQQIVMSNTRRCLNCHQKLDINNKDKTVRCQDCQTKQRIAELTKVLNTSITVKDQANNLKKFYVPQDVIMQFLTSQGKESLINDEDQMEDYFLELDDIKITHGSESDSISKIQVLKLD